MMIWFGAGKHPINLGFYRMFSFNALNTKWRLQGYIIGLYSYLSLLFNQQKGITKYGTMKFLWTTLTPIYDMNSTKRKALLKEKKKSRNKPSCSCILRTNKQATSKLVQVPKHKCLHNHRLNNTPVVDKTAESINKYCVLPIIVMPTKDSRKTQTPGTTI